MNYVSLHDGKIEIRFNFDDKLRYTFQPNETERMGGLIAEHRAWNFQSSSSCDFPQENGFKRSFDVGEVLGKAVEIARTKLAIVVEKPALAGADVAIEAIAKKWTDVNGFPVSLNFLKSGKEGQDVVVTFDEHNELEYFLAGLRYASRLGPCTNGKAWNASVSATPSSAPSVGGSKSTRASGRTTTAKGSRSTAGSAKRAARSARTKRG